VQKLDTHRGSTRETSSKVKSESASESESESVERAERASEHKKGAHRNTERVRGRERQTKRKTETEGQRGTETEIKREIETESDETERQGERDLPVNRAGVSKIETKSVKLVSISKEHGSGQGKRVDYTAQSPKHARTTTNRRTHSASPMGSCSQSLVGRSRQRSRNSQLADCPWPPVHRVTADRV